MKFDDDEKKAIGDQVFRFRLGFCYIKSKFRPFFVRSARTGCRGLSGGEPLVTIPAAPLH